MIRGRQELHTNSPAIAVLDLLLGRNLLLGLHFWRQGAPVRDIPAECHTQLLTVIGKKLRIVCPTRNSNVSHAVVEQVFGSKLCVDVDQHAISSLALAGMAGHGVAMIEMRMLTRIELHFPAAVHLRDNRPSSPMLALFRVHDWRSSDPGRAR